MNNSELVSVILPVCNVAEYLPLCLDSLIGQSYGSIEIVCVDDGSTDDSRAILEAYAARDRRIVVIGQDNRGVSAARNRGLEASKGEYIAFIDPDDWVDERYIEILMRGLRNHGADISACGIKSVRVSGERPEIHAASAGFSPVSPRFLLRHWSLRRTVTGKIYQRSILRGHEFNTALKRSEDTLFNLDVICHKKDVRIVYIDLPLYFYYFREDSSSHRVPMGEALGFSRWYCENPDLAEVTGYEWIFRLTAVKLALSSRYFALFEDDRADTVREANALLKQLIPGMLKSRFTPADKKISHLVLCGLPGLYRVLRLIEDPTLLIQEKKRAKKTLSCLRTGSPKNGAR